MTDQLHPKTFYIVQLMLEPDAEGTAPPTGWYADDDINYWYLADELNDAGRFNTHYEALGVIEKLTNNGTKVKAFQVQAAREIQRFYFDLELLS